MIQTGIALECLASAGVEEKFQVKAVRTSGDMKGKRFNPAEGSFADRINSMIAGGEIDIGVHSLKDLPAKIPEELEIAVVPKRASRLDCLLGAAPLFRLPTGSSIGTSSPRRAAQALRLRHDITIHPLRGNIGTRTGAVARGRVNAALLALAGLERLEFVPPAGLSVYPLSLDYFVPAAGQGAIAVVCRKGYLERGIRERATDGRCMGEIAIERTLLRELSAGCNSPLGISAVSFGRGYTVRIQMLSPDGSAEAKLTKTVRTGDETGSVLSEFRPVAREKLGELFNG
jgi:hydroxymethylbilane synthase